MKNWHALTRKYCRPDLNLYRRYGYTVFFCCISGILAAQCGVSNWGNLISNDCGDLQPSGGLAAGSPTIFCEGQTVTVENNSTPVADIQKTYIDWGDGTACQVFSGFRTGMTHIYDFPNDTCIRSNANGTLVFPVRLGVEKTCGTKKSFNFVLFNVVVRFKPVADFRANPQAACVATEIDFTNQSCENSNSATFLWTMGNGQTFTTENIANYQYPGGGTFNVTMAVTNVCGTDDVTKVITVLPPATANATLSAPRICAGQTVTFTQNSTNANSYTWSVTPSSGVSFVQPTNSSSPAPVIRLNNAGTYNIRMRVNGCGSPEQNFTVEVVAPASVNIGTLPDACAAAAVVMMPTASIGGSNPTIAWEFPGGTPGTASGANPGAVTYTAGGTYIVTATASNFCGTATDRDTFVIAPAATAAFTASATNLCGPDEVLVLTNASTNGGDYTWTVTPNAGFTYTNNTNNKSEHPQIKFSAEGTYTIQLRVNSCGNPVATHAVTVKLKPSAALAKTPDQCDQNVSLSPGNLLTLSGGVPASIEWEFMNGSVPSASGQNPSPVTFSGTGTYTLAVTVANQCGRATVSDTFRILPSATALAKIQDDSLCAPAEMLLIQNLSQHAFRDQPYKWTISPNTGFSFTANTSDTSAQPAITFIKEGRYTLQLEVNGCGMPVWDTLVHVILTPDAALQQVPDGCVDFSLDPLSVTTFSGGISAAIRWTFGGAAPAAATGATPGMVQFRGYGQHFIQVEIENACGTKTVTDSFNIIEPQKIVLPSVAPLCNTDTLRQLQAQPPGGSWSGQGITPAGVLNPADALLNQPTLLIYSIGTATCLVRDTLAILVRGTVVDVGADRSVCANSGVLSLSGYSPTGGNWAGDHVTPDGVFQTGAAGNGSHALTYTFRDNVTGCVNRDTLVVNVLGIPAANLDSIGRICVQEPLDLGAFSGGTGGNSCFWDFGDGQTSAQCQPSHTYTSPGAYQLTLIVKNNAQCTDTALTTIEVVSPPDAAFVTDVAQGCADLPVRIENRSALNDYTRYIWDYGNGRRDTLQQPGVVVFTQGEKDTVYTIRLRAVNGCGTASAERRVTVFPRPQVRFGTDFSNGCSPLEIQVNNVSVGNPDYYRWYVNGALRDTQFQLPQQVFYAFKRDSVYAIRLVAGNECGLDTAEHFITVRPNPVRSFFNTDTLRGCQPFNVVLIDYSTQGLYISWDFGDGTTATGDTVSHIFQKPGQFVVRNFANNGCGFDTSAVTITVLPAPPVSFAHLPFVCVNDTIRFKNTSPAIIGSVWNFGDNTTDSTHTSTFHVYKTPGTYRVSMTGFATATGCPATTGSTVEVKPLPVPDIRLPDSAGCAPLQIRPVNQTPGSHFYVWNFGDSTTRTGPDGSHLYTKPGSYALHVTVTDFFQCRNTWSFAPVQVYPVPQPDFRVTQTALCTTPTTLQFENRSRYADAFQWTFGTIGLSTAIHPSLTVAAPGVLNIGLRAVNQYGCRDSLVRPIRVYTRPVAEFTANDQTGCAPHTVSFENTSTGVNQFRWSFGDGSTSTVENPTHRYEKPGIFTVALYASADSLCFDSLRLNRYITVHPSPVAGFTAVPVTDTTVTPNGIFRFTNLSQNGIRHHWNFGDRDTSVAEHPVHRYLVNGPKIVTLITYNALNCPDTARLTVIPAFFGRLYVPNALSPDFGAPGERIFSPVGLGLSEYSVAVYASNGQRVWHSTALSNGRPSEAWNGQLNNTGNPLPQGVYFWKVFARFEDGHIWSGSPVAADAEATTEGKVLLVR